MTIDMKQFFSSLWKKPTQKTRQKKLNVNSFPPGTFLVLEMNRDVLSQLESQGSVRYDQKVYKTNELRGIVKACYEDDTGLFFYLEVVGVPEWGKRIDYTIYRNEIAEVKTSVFPDQT